MTREREKEWTRKEIVSTRERARGNDHQGKERKFWQRGEREETIAREKRKSFGKGHRERE